MRYLPCYTLLACITGSAFAAGTSDADQSLLLKADSVILTCKDTPEKIDSAMNFLKEEVTYHTKLPLSDTPDWLPKPLLNEKLSISYDNMLRSQKAIEADCQSMSYLTALLPALETGQGVTADDTTLIEGISTRLETDISGWKKDYTVFWKTLQETMEQYHANQQNNANTPAP